MKNMDGYRKLSADILFQAIQDYAYYYYYVCNFSDVPEKCQKRLKQKYEHELAEANEEMRKIEEFLKSKIGYAVFSFCGVYDTDIITLIKVDPIGLYKQINKAGFELQESYNRTTRKRFEDKRIEKILNMQRIYGKEN